LAQIISSALERQMKSHVPAPSYTPYHPRWYRKRVSTYWWLESWAFTKFILRELTSLAVAYSVVFTLVQIFALSRGPEAYAHFQIAVKNPFLIALTTISFLFAVYHTITWFNLAPRAMTVRIAGKRVPEILISGPNFVAWLVVSAIVAWFVMRG
jgi:fumarate reductase subunit C